MTRRSTLTAMLTVASVLIVAPPATRAEPTSERYAFSTFREEAGRVTVFADGYPATMGGDAHYIPISVAVALTKSGKSIAFTPESFTLVDAAGQAVPAAGFEELNRNYEKLTYDRSLVRMRPIVVGSYVSDLRPVDSRFYPPVNGGTRIPRVELGPFTWFNDVLYFPRPAAGLGGVLTLRVAMPEGDPVDVRFEVSREALAKH
jgi:hypothetical protein